MNSAPFRTTANKIRCHVRWDGWTERALDRRIVFSAVFFPRSSPRCTRPTSCRKLFVRPNPNVYIYIYVYYAYAKNYVIKITPYVYIRGEFFHSVFSARLFARSGRFSFFFCPSNYYRNTFTRVVLWFRVCDRGRFSRIGTARTRSANDSRERRRIWAFGERRKIDILFFLTSFNGNR